MHEVDERVERLRRQNEELMREAESIETDSLYVENLLERWRRIAPNEILLDR